MFRNLSITLCFFLCFGLSSLTAQKPVISGYFGKKSFIGLKYQPMLAAFPTPKGDYFLINDEEYLNNSTFPMTHQIGLEYGKTFTRSLNLYVAASTTRLGAETAILKSANNGEEAITNAFVSFRSVVVQAGIQFKGKKYWSMPPIGKYAGFQLYYAKALQPNYLYIEDFSTSTFEKYEECDCSATLTEENKTSGFGLIFTSGYRKPISKDFYYNIGASLGIAFGGGNSQILITRARQSQFFTIDFTVGKLL